MLALGLPTGPVTAVLMAALLIHGVPPGPQLVTEHPDVFWGFIASMYVGNLMLLALNLPLVSMFVIPYLPSWLFDGPGTVKHWPRRHVCGVCGEAWTQRHTCRPAGPMAGPLRGELRRLAPPANPDRTPVKATPRRSLVRRGR